ncbi:hypothetical protein ElyMa_005124000 [Elysia marginata]|uniref:Uncharacterized protein n=1 Tax=Elysia marginata TaxID=1093978 RepID=A0AAV4JMP2_9GAST|nr:hypothetical protein ElyMa_005124000 [Elysia marginata]
MNIRTSVIYLEKEKETLRGECTFVASITHQKQCDNHTEHIVIWRSDDDDDDDEEEEEEEEDADEEEEEEDKGGSSEQA